METSYYPRPTNFVAEINGHLIVRRKEDGKCYLWNAEVGWWAFGLEESHARRVCEAIEPCVPNRAKGDSQ